MSAPNELSFLPEDYLEQKWKRRANLVCVVLIGLAGAGVGGAWSWKHADHARVATEAAAVDSRYTEAARKIAQVKKMNDQQGQVMRHAEVTASLYEKVPRSNILAELTLKLPSGVSLLELNMTSTQHKDESAAPRTSFEAHVGSQQSQEQVRAPHYDVKLAVTGIAQTDSQVAALISGLKRSNLFRDVNLVVSDAFEERRPDGQKGENTEIRRKWQIEMMLNPDAEVREDNKAAAVELNR